MSGKYKGSERYISNESLNASVNAAVTLERPLLIKGEPGTGKTLLAHSIAESLGMKLMTWHVKSTTRAQDGLYLYDVVRRLNDSRFGTGDITNIENYIDLGVLGKAFESEERVVLLIDEVDKADPEFPNDLLHELDAMEFAVVETGRVVKASKRPIVVITSNAEKELPDAFLRRCVFHYIEFPDTELMEKIVEVHFPDMGRELLLAALQRFYDLRKKDSLQKKPSTSELIDWLMVLVKGGVSMELLTKSVPFLGVLLKKESDVDLIRKGGRYRYN
jgi:MoxR-like ATPase